MTKTAPSEKLTNRLATKDVYHYVDSQNGINIISREVYKDGKMEIHYPFRKDGKSKYGNIKKFIYDEMPKTLPRGFNKTYTKGFGLTRPCRQLVYSLQQKYPNVETLIFSTRKKSAIGSKEIIIYWQDFDKQYNSLSVLLQKHSDETKALAEKVLSKIFPDKFKKGKSRYIKNSMGTYLNDAAENIKDFSASDVQAVVDLFAAVAEEKEGIDTTKTLKTKEIIEEYYLEEVLEEFKKQLKQKTDTSTLEKRWQKFFRDYNWIFSQLFSFPVLYFASEAYVGGKTIENKSGKVVDFIYKNELTNNIALIEIKTHLTQILEAKPYRGKDVFSITKDFSGAIAQILDQKDNLLKDFNNISKGMEIEAFNPKCIVVIGEINPLTKEQKKSFELFRNSYKEVSIITFDEVCNRIQSLLNILKGKIKTT